MSAEPPPAPPPAPPPPDGGRAPEVGFGALLRTSFLLCLATGLCVLGAFGLYQLYRWLT